MLFMLENLNLASGFIRLSRKHLYSIRESEPVLVSANILDKYSSKKIMSESTYPKSSMMLCLVTWCMFCVVVT